MNVKPAAELLDRRVGIDQVLEFGLKVACIINGTLFSG